MNANTYFKKTGSKNDKPTKKETSFQLQQKEKDESNNFFPKYRK